MKTVKVTTLRRKVTSSSQYKSASCHY